MEFPKAPEYLSDAVKRTANYISHTAPVKRLLHTVDSVVEVIVGLEWEQRQIDRKWRGYSKLPTNISESNEQQNIDNI